MCDMSNDTDLSLAVLRRLNKGDMVLFQFGADCLSLYRVVNKATMRGRSGGTVVSLDNVHKKDDSLRVVSTKNMPEGVTMVRKVIAGINVRTIRKLGHTSPKVTKTNR